MTSSSLWAQATLPSGAEITQGQAQLKQQANTLTIQQQTDKLAINWQQFNIGKDHHVTFQQPSAQAIALNRVLGNNRTEIYGNLQANGQVFLLNPNGILFSKTAQVQLGGLVASTGQLQDSDFLEGRYYFTDIQGDIINQGHLNAQTLTLIGQQIHNSGQLTSATNNPNQAGYITLAAGQTVNLAIDPANRITVTIDAPTTRALISQGGLIQTENGHILLTAQGQNQLMNTIINHSGTIRARRLHEHNGTIVLDGGPNGITQISGTLDASSAAPHTTGGDITVLGQHLHLTDSAHLNVSGEQGGGTLTIGGNPAGKGPLPNSQTLIIAPDADLQANALSQGNGGTITTWGTEANHSQGRFSAKGGAQQGNGGHLETSGNWLNVDTIKIDLSAPQGKNGSWLLDPINLTISATGNTATPDSNNTITPSTTTTLQASTINTLLNQGNAIILRTSGGNDGQGDIVVNSDLSKTAGGDATLTLIADRNLNLGSNITSTTGKLNLNLYAGAKNDGYLSLGSINSNGGEINLLVGNAVPLTDPKGSNPSYSTAPGSISLYGATLNSGGGDHLIQR